MTITKKIIPFILMLILIFMPVFSLNASAAVVQLTAAQVPFTYTGSWDAYEYEPGKFYARLLTNGTFTPKASMTLDVFLVGSGQGGHYYDSSSSNYAGTGGAGGSTTTAKNILVPGGTAVAVTVGASNGTWYKRPQYGGNGDTYWVASSSGIAGNPSSFGSYATAAGGGATGGGSGAGSGGTSLSSKALGGEGGTNGGNGYTSNSSSSYGTLRTSGNGLGQGVNTYAFGGDKFPFNTMLFSGGGGGGGFTSGSTTYNGGPGGSGGGGAGATGLYTSISSNANAIPGTSGTDNTGGGGGGGAFGVHTSGSPNTYNAGRSGAGGSGIVIIRGDLDSVPSISSTTVSFPSSITYNSAYNVSWTAATSSTGTLGGYKLERQINGGTWTQIYQGTALSFSQTLTRNQASTVNYRVKAYSTGALESAYATGTARTVINNNTSTTPGAVSVPASVNRWQASTYVVSWGASTDPDGDQITYVLEYAVNNSSTFTQIITTTATSYMFTIPSSNPSNIQFRVKAKDPSGAESGYSTGGWTTIGYNSPPTDPTGMSSPSMVSSWSSNTIVFNWNASTDANGDTINYIVERSVNGGSWTSVQNSTTRSYTHTISIPSDNTVQIRVRAYDSKEYSGYLTSSLIPITHDTTSPTIQVVATPVISAGGIHNEISITVMMADAGSGLKLLTVPAGVTPEENQTLSSATATKTFKATASGTYSFTVSDNAGNIATGSAVVTAVSISPQSHTMNVGTTFALETTISPSDASSPSIAWTSSDNAVATVDANGVVTARAAGIATITATPNNGITGICSITVVEPEIPVTEVSISPQYHTMDAGTAFSLEATVTPNNATNKSIVWTSSDNAIATVDANGVVTAAAAGSATITATSNNEVSGVCNITVIEPDVPENNIKINDDSNRIVYSGTWLRYNDIQFYSGDEHCSNEVGAYAELEFNGTSICLIGATSNNLGKCDIYLDGELVEQALDLYSASLEAQKILFSKTGLQSGQHTIRIVVTGEKNDSATECYVTVDAFVFTSIVESEVSENIIKINDDSTRIVYSGTWLRYNDIQFFNGDEHYSNEVGAYAELEFNGTGIRLIGATSNNLGKCDIYLDGELVEQAMDLYSPNLETQKKLFSKAGLPSGQHIIRIVVISEKNDNATDCHVTVDAFMVIS